MRKTLPAIALVLMSYLATIQQLTAQGISPQYSSYVTPFPEHGTYRVLVLGDSIGEGLSFGLSKAFKNDRSLQLINRAKWGTGFSRRKHIGRAREFEPLLASIKPDIVLISVGAKDAVASILEGKKKYRFGSERWKQIYSERLDKILRRLKKQKVAIYWIGLPIMRDPGFNENMNTLNELFREKAHLNNIKFIDTWNGFVDQYGNFSPYGPDLDGRVLRLRHKDGIRFTGTGYRKLAHYVEREIRRDLIAARSERNVPLAGNASEQLEINQKMSAGNLAKIPGANSGGQPNTARKTGARTTSSAAAFGEVIASDRASGLTLLSSITRTNDPSLSGGRHTLPLTLRPYYRVLVKGETLASKPGRSDDFTQNKIN
ncbi:MAG: DUF459 domain-containing protein [bacterium]|nr:DUF459 domain-containing protein [bacterium]